METRGLSYLLKDIDCPPAVRQIAAREMAALIWGPCNLIPVPSHTGECIANTLLCQAIAEHVPGGTRTYCILRREGEVESQNERHKRGQGPLAPADHKIVRITDTLIPARATWFVDNVTTSGNTILACHQAMKWFGRGLVFADAWQSIVRQSWRNE
jgi:hypothetical protein